MAVLGDSYFQYLTLTVKDNFMYNILLNMYGSSLFEHTLLEWQAVDKLFSLKQADLDLHYFK